MPTERSQPGKQRTWLRRWQHRIHSSVQRRTLHLPDATRGLLWAAAAGLMFTALNGLMRLLAMRIGRSTARLFLRERAVQHWMQNR